MTSENYIRESDKLLKEWKNTSLHNDKVFISDGIIDLNKWGKKKKILLILKEAYGSDEDWSLTETIKDEWKGPKYKVWWTVSYWLYLLNKTTKDFVPLFPNKEEEAQCIDYLLSSAVLNIKKSNGRSYSEIEDLKKYVESDKDFILKQIEIINPDIILCGNTGQFLFPTVFGEPNKIENTDWHYRWKNRMIIDYWHPANQYPDELCYYALGQLYQRILTE